MMLKLMAGLSLIFHWWRLLRW